MFSISLNLKRIQRIVTATMLSALLFTGLASPARAEIGTSANTALPKSFSNSSNASSPMERMNAREDRMVHEMFQKLQMSALQKSNILSIVSEARLKNKPLSVKAEQYRSDMLAYLKSKNATLAGAKARAEKIHTMMGDLAQRRLETWFQIRQQLTPKQLENLNQLKM